MEGTRRFVHPIGRSSSGYSADLYIWATNFVAFQRVAHAMIEMLSLWQQDLYESHA
jgi:hypothetical protein